MWNIPQLIEGSGKFLAFRCWSDSDGGMIRGGFLGEEDRNKLIALARDGAAASRMTRRANALVLLDDGWSCREVAKALLLQTSGRQRINVHGAIDLETGRTRMIEVETVDAVSTIRLLESIEAFYPMLALIHVFLDNARYHHAKLVQDWLSRPDCRIRLHFIPAYCPHLNPIERLWGVMHKHVTHNKCYATCSQFADATLGFLRETVPRNWANLCDSVTDNFRVISPKDFRVMA